MGKAPSTIYNIVHLPSGRSAEVEVLDNDMRNANSGAINYQKIVSVAFRYKISSQLGRDPGRIQFDDLGFELIRKVRPVKPKFSGCACDCAWCDQGGHCRKKNSGCNVW